MDRKLCEKCGCEKDASEFPVKKDGERRYVARSCRACANLAQNRRYGRTTQQQEEQARRARNAMLAAAGERQCSDCEQVLLLSAFRLKGGRPVSRCSECQSALQRAQYAENRAGIRDRLKVHGQKRRQAHGPRLNEQKREYVAANRRKVTDRQNRWAKEKLKADPLFAMKKRLRSLMSNAFRSVACAKSAETEQILGCTFLQFKAHIERQFTAGMTWSNRGEWHLDHILPLATAETEADIVRLNHFTNYRPLWAAENIAKGAKIVALL